MEAALVSQDGSWHWDMLWKRLDKNNRILPAVFKEVCRWLIKDSDLCGLRLKKQILCFLNNGAFQRGCNVQHPQQRARSKYSELNNRQEMKNRFGSSHWYLCWSISDLEYYFCFYLEHWRFASDFWRGLCHIPTEWQEHWSVFKVATSSVPHGGYKTCISAPLTCKHFFLHAGKLT